MQRGGSVVKNPPASAGDERDMDSIPGWGRSPGGWNGSPLPYSCLKNSMDRGVWWAIVYGVAKSWTWQSNTAWQEIQDFTEPFFHVLENFIVVYLFPSVSITDCVIVLAYINTRYLAWCVEKRDKNYLLRFYYVLIHWLGTLIFLFILTLSLDF